MSAFPGNPPRSPLKKESNIANPRGAWLMGISGGTNHNSGDRNSRIRVAFIERSLRDLLEHFSRQGRGATIRRTACFAPPEPISAALASAITG